MDFSKTLFRASSMGHLMTPPKSKEDKAAGNLSESAKKHLMDIYVSKRYGRRTDIQSKYTNKGQMVEEDSVTLFSRVTKTFYRKNEENLTNEFFSGTPDMYEGEEIRKATKIVDVKSSWDIYTFFRTLSQPLNTDYFWQLQTYMELSTAETSELGYCLIDTPISLIEDEKRRLLWKMGSLSAESPEYLEAADLIEKNLTYPDIPIEERLIKFKIDRSQEAIDLMKDKVVKARRFLNEFEEQRFPLK